MKEDLIVLGVLFTLFVGPWLVIVLDAELGEWWAKRRERR